MASPFTTIYMVCQLELLFPLKCFSFFPLATNWHEIEVIIWCYDGPTINTREIDARTRSRPPWPIRLYHSNYADAQSRAHSTDSLKNCFQNCDDPLYYCYCLNLYKFVLIWKLSRGVGTLGLYSIWNYLNLKTTWKANNGQISTFTNRAINFSYCELTFVK